MKIRVMGTKEECEQARRYYSALSGDENVKSVSISDLYPNRNSFNIFRVYIDVEYYGIAASPAAALTERARKTR